MIAPPPARFIIGATAFAAKSVLEVDGYQPVEHRRIDLFQGVAHIVGGVVDQHGDGAERMFETLYRRLEGDVIGDVAVQKLHGVPLGTQERRQSLTLALCPVHKAHPRPLRGEGPHHKLTNARSTSGNQHGLTLEVGIHSLRNIHITDASLN